MNYCFYPHPSSKNHGCEAIAVCTYNILKKYVPDSRTELLTKYPLLSEFGGGGKVYDIYDKITVFPLPSLKKYSFSWFKYQISKLKKQDKAVEILSDEIINNDGEIFERNDIFISIGGDNYCYGRPASFYAVNKAVHKKQKKSILYGCSIEPKAIDEEMKSDLRQYDKIVVRESLTFNALKENGIDNAVLYPDPAFTLEPIDSGIKLTNTIGINISPMIYSYSDNESVVFDSFVNLIKYILNNTDCNIALIPHVTAKTTNDLDSLNEIKNVFAKEERISLIADTDCQRLKDIISQCRIFIGARTHATIAAYSSCVPTLVCGYSVKAKGIAKDLFGTYKNYVLPVQDLKENNNLTEAFKYISANENDIRNTLKNIMPDYIERAWLSGKELINEKS